VFFDRGIDSFVWAVLSMIFFLYIILLRIDSYKYFLKLYINNSIRLVMSDFFLFLINLGLLVYITRIE